MPQFASRLMVMSMKVRYDFFRHTPKTAKRKIFNLDKKVSWHDESDIMKFAGKAVRLQFMMRESKLYSFHFSDFYFFLTGLQDKRR